MVFMKIYFVTTNISIDLFMVLVAIFKMEFVIFAILVITVRRIRCINLYFHDPEIQLEHNGTLLALCQLSIAIFDFFTN